MLEGRGDEHRSVENACQRLVQYLEVSITPTSTVDQLLANSPLRRHLGEGRPTNGQQFNDQFAR